MDLQANSSSKRWFIQYETCIHWIYARNSRTKEITLQIAFVFSVQNILTLQRMELLVSCSSSGLLLVLWCNRIHAIQQDTLLSWLFKEYFPKSLSGHFKNLFLYFAWVLKPWRLLWYPFQTRRYWLFSHLLSHFFRSPHNILLFNTYQQTLHWCVQLNFLALQV